MKKTARYLLHFLLFFWIGLSHANEPLTILLDWFPYPAHAPLFVGLDQGFFKAHGLTINLVAPADPADPPKLVAAGEADIAITYEPQFIEQVGQGLPLVRIATLIDQPLDCLVVLKGPTIHSIADLKGKKIAYSVNGLANIALKTMLNKNGLSLGDVELINVHYDLTQALLAKQVDAITSVMRNLEVIQLESMGQKTLVFYPEKNGVPTYSELIFIVNKNKINDPRFIQFLLALQESCDYLQKYPYQSWALFAHNHPQFNSKLYQRSWVVTLPYFARHPAEFNPEAWSSFAEFMKTNGLISKVQPVDHYAINLLKGH